VELKLKLGGGNDENNILRLLGMLRSPQILTGVERPLDLPETY
jgi:hypothetical protein